MKTFRKILLVFTSLALVNTAMAQLKPDALGAFDKIVLDPKVKKIIIKKGSILLLRLQIPGRET